MGSESNSPSPSSSSSPSGKRSRDPEDEVYLDNLHSHKRYLSEGNGFPNNLLQEQASSSLSAINGLRIMASSLNGLTVGDPLHENLMESPARSETMFYLRDDMSLQYSPMSEDSDDNRYCEIPINISSSQTDSLPTSPVSPHRYQRPFGALSSSGTTACSSHGCTLATVACAQPRQRGSDSEGRFPSSPSDICHSADLRRAALLRSVQMRAQPPGPSVFELPFSAGQEAVPNMETEERPCLVDERDYHIEECSSMGISEHEFNREKSCRVLNMNLKGEEPGD